MTEKIAQIGYCKADGFKEPDYAEEKKKKSPYTKTRVIHDPRQVRSPEELISGRKYERRRNVDGETVISSNLLEVTSLEGTSLKPLRKGWFRAQIVSRTGDFMSCENEVSMADIGIIPYNCPKDFWNATNYMVPVEETNK